MEIDGLWGLIKAHFFYSARSCIATIFLIIGLFFLYALLKDNYDKLGKTLKNIVIATMNLFLAFALF